MPPPFPPSGPICWVGTSQYPAAAAAGTRALNAAFDEQKGASDAHTSTRITTSIAAGAVAVSSSANNGAQPVNFNDRVAFSCDGALGGTPGASFAVIKSDGNGTVNADVALKHALPNTSYRVNLIQSGCSKRTTAFITTAGQGNVNIRLSAPQTSNSASVLANSHGAPNMKQTPGRYSSAHSLTRGTAYDEGQTHNDRPASGQTDARREPH